MKKLTYKQTNKLFLDSASKLADELSEEAVSIYSELSENDLNIVLNAGKKGYNEEVWKMIIERLLVELSAVFKKRFKTKPLGGLSDRRKNKTAR